MKAAVVNKPGSPNVLQIQERQIPDAKPGWVLVRVRAAGLNRSEMYTRQGHSPGIQFPRVLGIECVGEVAQDGDETLLAGQKVVACMGGMGREFDGGYAEYALLPRNNVFAVNTELDWPTLATIPETFGTTWGALHEALEVKAGEILLVRGGTSSVGMSAVTVAKDLGLTVIASTRNESKRDVLIEQGADHVVIGGNKLERSVRAVAPDGVHKVLELVGTMTLQDSFACTRIGGTVCLTGVLADEWVIKDWEPFLFMKPGVKFTTGGITGVLRHSNPSGIMQEICNIVAAGRYKHGLHKVFPLNEVAAAHQYMEDNQTIGKLVLEMN